MRKIRTYTLEEKQAVLEDLKTGMDDKVVAKKHKMPAGTVHWWATKGIGEKHKKATNTNKNHEIKKLKKEIDRLTLENIIIKAAVYDRIIAEKKGKYDRINNTVS